MNLEDLTKTQMVLLTLLVCFVTSIATGIITVSLLEQAPPIVTQTVSRVIQNTIEKVSPDASKPTQTIVVKEEDLVVDAIDQNAKNLVALKENVNGNQGALLGTGFLVSKDGLVLTDSEILLGNQKVFVLSGGVAYQASVVTTDTNGFSILRIVPTKDDAGTVKTFSSAVFGDSTKLKVGQTVISPSSLDGESLNVAKGIISGVNQDSANAPQTITLTMSLGKASSGSPLLNTDGEVVGLVIANGSTVSVIPANILAGAVKALPAIQ